MAQRRQQAERSETTRQALLAAARELFTARGFAAVPAEELVHRAGLTRGALYHHFDGKEGLLAALYEQSQQEIATRIAAAAEAAPDAWTALRAGCQAFLTACADPALQRIVLHDAPAVLGWEQWRAVDERYGLGLLKQGLEAAMASGAVTPLPLDALAHLLTGAMNEAAMWIARVEQQEQALEAALVTLDRLLDGLRPAASDFSRSADINVD